ncbi:hypothetical protein Namu_2073 [Nakamurella multipartita DSM 44233]|uniref:Uncharacterized protein n=1 Tax=Nakamurella multipartita (strain ATCC 700099 / DSM 44233 / CIP 104796 / JCM 9543 / NBRC 105858 / Y-104) TaxID=479431 RepID=C8XI83_NAKMY|nr:hypothetical protein Namu_2073 [Nakamurella multipartita DSM 44233]
MALRTEPSSVDRRATDCQLAGATSFEDFLASETYIEYRFSQSEPTPCLLDLIDVWLVLGNATEVCASFESFLLTVIQITDWWDHQMMPFSRKSVRTTLLWPDTPELGADDFPGATIPFGPYAWSEGEHDVKQLAVKHPVLNRERWESIRTARRLGK